MNFVRRIVLLFTFLFAIQFAIGQSSAINKNIKTQAEAMTKAYLDGDYEKQLQYIHPNVIKAAGGKENFLKFVVPQIEKMIADGFVTESVEIGEPTNTQLYKGEYQTLVPKTLTIRYQGQRISSKNHLFGFSDAKGEKWTFIEAEKLLTEAGKSLFPNFETNIDIPDKEAPITEVIDQEGENQEDTQEETKEEKQEETNEEAKEGVTVPEFDENAGTYDTPEETGESIGYMIGIGVGIVLGIGLLVGLIFLILYLIKPKKKQAAPAPSASASAKQTPKKSTKVVCTNCASENSGDAKYCAFCGHAIGA